MNARSICIFACSLLLAVRVQGDGLNHGLEKKVRSATLEVVIALPKTDQLTYEKTLPLELLPFALRNASHVPIGTAFCIGRNQYLSAAHVLNAGIGSQWGAPVLRDQTGKLYEIGELLKYSALEDFALFSLKDPPDSQTLDVNGNPELSSRVFAVGNALGEGIIIRDGMFTSVTPEDLDGGWNWLRFSAAASPGNSGGPLLDEKGRVIGIVVAKSPSENLNYALPIGRVVAAKDGVASIESRTSFSLNFAPESIVFKVNETFSLPLSYGRFSAMALEVNQRSFDRARSELLAAYPDKYFPKGDSSLELLQTSDWAIEPRLVVKKDGKWDALKPESTVTTDLGNGGSFVGGNIAGTGLARISLPDDVQIADLVTDSKRFMDLFLKGTTLSRSVGPESVRVTSLGTAREEKVFVDSYQRKWLLRSWEIPFLDARMVSAALPVPGGFAVLTHVAPTSQAYEVTERLKMATDLIYLTYSGTIARWRAYLALTSMHPAVFSTIKLDIEAGHGFKYQSPRFEFLASQELLDVNDKNELSLAFSYFEDKDKKVVWDVARLWLGEDAKNTVAANIERYRRPSDSLPQHFKDDWLALTKRRSPYDARPFRSDDGVMISTPMTRSATSRETNISPDASVVYLASYYLGAPGFGPEELSSLHKMMIGNLRIRED